VLKNNKEMDYPCELYLEGSDQHRGWFQSALITAMAIDGISPYRNVLTHGFVVDGEGKKMSKSMGNVITPEQVMKRYGADILRLWVASSDYSEDIRMSDEILTRLADAYRKIRNTYKYLLSNLYDFDPAKDRVAHGKMLEIDRWILSKLSSVINAAAANYDTYSFHKVYREVYNFCIYEVSSVYLDILKDRMYTYKADSPERRSGQTAIFEILNALLKIMAPILSITSEEAWSRLIPEGTSGSVHMEAWPSDKTEEWHDEKLNDKWSALISVREAVLKKLEEKRQSGEIGSSLETKVVLTAGNENIKKLLVDNREQLRYLFIVSEVAVKESCGGSAGAKELVPVSVFIEKAGGQKCQRCWNYTKDVGMNKEHPTLCARCVKNI
ncbi:MAG: class I tRNA ligase family protein, partial [Candidatus Omnitrophica bacterium]|nr:class I tRNA ligase family protein [Candidatus Omnitrophota bacterium]